MEIVTQCLSSIDLIDCSADSRYGCPSEPARDANTRGEVADCHMSSTMIGQDFETLAGVAAVHLTSLLGQ